MAITTLDGVIAGAEPPQFYCKSATGTVAAGRPVSPFYLSGIPGAAATPTPGMSGAALTSYAGQIPWINPTAGQNTYLSRFGATNTGNGGTILLCDRLWHNSGINVTLTTAQTINSVAWPARDNNGSTNGEGILIGLEVSAATGAGNPTLTLSYTNSAGTSGRTATNAVTTVGSNPQGTFYPIGLQAGDLGVRSIQTYTQSGTWTSGTVHLVAYRVLASVQTWNSGVFGTVDAITGGFPRLYDDTVPFILFIPASTTTGNIAAVVTFTQG